jgi:hypothetical protein
VAGDVAKLCLNWDHIMCVAPRLRHGIIAPEAPPAPTSAFRLANMNLDSVQAIHKIAARFPPWPDIESLFKSESFEMFARLSSNPPLGVPTVISAAQGSLHFRAGLDLHVDNKEDWEVELWHNFEGDWKGNVFEHTKGSNDVVSCYGRFESCLTYYSLTLASWKVNSGEYT